MNTFKNIILALPILFISCDKDPFVECEWATVFQESTPDVVKYHYYLGADSFDNDNGTIAKRCVYIHYYEDGNYMIVCGYEENGSVNNSGIFTVDLSDDRFIDFEYEEK